MNAFQKYHCITLFNKPSSVSLTVGYKAVQVVLIVTLILGDIKDACSQKIISTPSRLFHVVKPKLIRFNNM